MKKQFLIILIITMIYMFPINSFAEENMFSSDSKLNLTAISIKSKMNIDKISYESNINENTILSSEQSKLGVNDFISESKKYTDEFDLNKVFTSSLTGKFDNKKIFKFISNLLEKNIKVALTSIAGIIIIVIINSILKTISENLGNESVSKIASYVQYILIVTIIMKNFSNVITSVKDTMQNLNLFANSLIPLLMTLLITTGNIVSSNMLEPILLLMVTFISNFICNVLIPIILAGTAIGIVSKISNQVQVDRLAKFFKSSTVWITTTILTIFVTLSSLEGGLTSGIDGVTAKASKSVISAAVPIVGNILGDAVSTVMGYANIIKNAVGAVGIIVIICICAKPIVELAALTIVYYLGAALCQPIADKNIVELIEQIGGTFKILLAILFVVTTMLIIGLAVVMKVSNNGMMYS